MAPLGFKTTALQALQGADLTGKVAIVTGGNSGIGVETVRALATAGASVVLTSRNVDAGKKVAAEITAKGVKGSIEVMQLDLADLGSIKEFATAFLAAGGPLHFLVQNAGVMACPYGTTKDGFEMQIGTNHLGHFYLTRLLLPLLKSQAAPSRIVVVSSSLHRKGVIALDDLHWHKRKYDPWGSYGQSKLANVLFAKELTSRLASEAPQVTAVSLHPGVIPTPLSRHVFMGYMFRGAGHLLSGIAIFKTIPQGAATSVWACVDESISKHGGAFLEDCRISTASKAGQDAALAGKLWEVSEVLLLEALSKRGL